MPKSFFASAILGLLLCPVAGAEMGGLTALPFNTGVDDIERSASVLANRTFSGGATGWTLPPAYVYDAAVSRTADGSGSLNIRPWISGITVDSTTDVFTAPYAHGMVAGTTIRFESTGTVPAPLALGTNYFVRSVTSTTFKVATTNSDATIVDITGTGTGTHSIIAQGELEASQIITPATYGTNRIFRIRAYLKASADPGESANFRIYMFIRGTAFACGGSGADLAGLGATWKEYTLDFGKSGDLINGPKEGCSLVHLRDPHLDQNISFRLLSSGIPNGVNVWVDDIQMVPVVRPLVIFPTYPNYNGMLWADQGTTMKWKAIADVPDGETLGGLTARVQVVRKSDSAVMATVTDSTPEALRTSGVWAGYSVNSMTYDASGLADGVYYLRGTLRRTSDDAELYAYPDYKIIKEQPSVQRDSWKVWINKDNMVVLNGVPRFIHGTYGGFTGARNTFPSGAGISNDDPNAYRAWANGCDGPARTKQCNESLHPSPTLWNRGYNLPGGHTLMKEMADARMNMQLMHQHFNSYSIGFTGPSNTLGFAATGTIVTSGLNITGSGTLFGAEVLGTPASSPEPGYGDSVSVQRSGTGTISSSGTAITGVGTSFTSQMREGDEICVGTECKIIYPGITDTTLTIRNEPVTPWSGAAFTVRQYRRINTVSSATSATLASAFLPDVGSGIGFLWNKCQIDGGRYDPINARIAHWITALQDYDIWYLHTFNVTTPVLSTYWGSANPRYQINCNLITPEEGVYFVSRYKPYIGENGFLGTHAADEPGWIGQRGIQTMFSHQKGLEKASKGGITHWADGAVPRFAFDMWNNILNTVSPDPYPVSGNRLLITDDVAYNVRKWNKHGRSWHWPRRSGGSVMEARPVFGTIQLFTWYTSDGLHQSSYPGVSDLKIQAVSALAAGVQGITYWHILAGLSTLGDRDSLAWLAWRKTSKFLAEYMDVLDTPVRDYPKREDGDADYGRIIASVSDPNIACSSRERGTIRYLACANLTTTQIAATITMVEPIAGKVLVAWDGTTITPATSTTFTHTFNGLDGVDVAGTGTITSTNNWTVTCSTCTFLSEGIGVKDYERETITANGSTRMIMSVDSNTQLTVDDKLPTGSTTKWDGHTWTHSANDSKAKSVEVFVIQAPAASRTITGR